MGKVVSFMNMKGGVGKTTMCLNLAYFISKNTDKKILLIDVDPQFNLTQYYFSYFYKFSWAKELALVSNAKNIKSIYEQSKSSTNSSDNQFFTNKNQPTNSISKNDDLKYIIHTNAKNTNLSIIPGTINILDLEFKVNHKKYNTLKDYIDNTVRNEYEYDYIFIDCPPTYSFFFISAYVATDIVVIPTTDNYFSNTGLYLFNKAETELINSGIVANSSKKDKLGIIFTSVSNKTNRYLNDVKSELKFKEEFSDMRGIYMFNNYIKNYKCISSSMENSSLLSDMTEYGIRDSIRALSLEFIERMDSLE